MFARLVEVLVKPGKHDEVMPVITNEVLPFLAKQPGFIDFIVLSSETDPNFVTTLSLWATKKESEESWASQKFKTIIEPIASMGELMVRTFNVEALVREAVLVMDS